MPGSGLHLSQKYEEALFFSQRCLWLARPAPWGSVYSEDTFYGTHTKGQKMVEAAQGLHTVWVPSHLPIHLRSGKQGGRKDWCVVRSCPVLQARPIGKQAGGSASRLPDP